MTSPPSSSTSSPPLDTPLKTEELITSRLEYPEPPSPNKEEVLRQLIFYQKQNLLLITELASSKRHIEILNERIFKLMAENAALVVKK